MDLLCPSKLSLYTFSFVLKSFYVLVLELDVDILGLGFVEQFVVYLFESSYLLR